MKKTRVFALLTAALLIFSASAFAAGSSFTVSADKIISSEVQNRKLFRVITTAFVADSVTGAIPDLTLNAATTGIRSTLSGWYGYKIIIDGNHAGTEPTENSEVYIYENGFDLLAAGGVDQVDNTAERQVFFNNGTYNIKQPITGDLTVTVTQQAAATASATGTIYIYLVGE